MKRTLALILAIVLTLSLLPVTANADEAVGEGKVKTKPTTRVYAKGHDFDASDLDGLVIQYREDSDSEWKDVTYSESDSRFSIMEPAEGTELTTIGDNNIHLHYTYADGKYVEINVSLEIKERLFTGLTVKTAPTKANYYEGEKIDLTGLELVRNYTNKTTETLTDFDSSVIHFTPSRTDELVPANTTINVKYTEDGKTDTEQVRAISVKAAADKVGYTADADSHISIPVTGTKTVTAVIKDGGADYTDADGYSWHVEDGSIASIATSGKSVTITGKKAGSTRITLRTKGSNLDLIYNVTVTDGIPPTAVYLNHKDETDVPIGSTLLLEAIGFDPFTTTKKDVTWSSSNPAVATVSSTGLVTAITNGTTTITCTAVTPFDASAGPAGYAKTTCDIKVVETPVTSITLSASAITLYVDKTDAKKGSSRTITATVGPDSASNKSVAWSSGNETIATVDSSGKITAKAKGTARITATAAGGLTATVTVTVKEAVLLNELSVTPEIASLYVGQSLTAAVKLHPSNATTQTVTWTSDRPEVAKVSSAGKITALAQGTAIITATADDGSGKTDTIAVTVNNITVESVLQTVATASVLETKTVQLYASIYPSTATNKSVTWSSLNTAVATVSSSGLVTGVSKGNVVIRATAKDGSSNYADCVVTVNERTRVSSLKINYKSFSLVLGDSTYLSATILPADATSQNVEWESSNTGVATVSSSGLLKGLALGTTVITASADGKTTSITVTVAESRSSYGVVSNCARRVNVRSVPDGSRGFLGFAYKGQSYKVIGESGNWYKIEYDGENAYIWKDYMSSDTATSYVPASSQTTTPPASGTTTTPPAATTGSTVTVDNCRRRVNVRATADANGAHLGYAYLNDSFAYIATSGDWYQINFDGVVAYIHSAYCSLSI